MNWVKMRKRSTLGNRYHDTISFLFVVCIYIYICLLLLCVFTYLHSLNIYTKKYEYVYACGFCNRIFLFFSICMEPVCESSVNHRSFHPQEKAGTETWINDANLQRVVVNLFGGMGFLVFLEGMAALGTVWYDYCIHGNIISSSKSPWWGSC